MARFRLLAVLAAICLAATACPATDDEDTGADTSSSSANDDEGQAADASEAADEPDPEPEAADPEPEPVEDEPSPEPAEEAPEPEPVEEESAPAPDLGMPLTLGGPAGDDILLDLEAGLILDAEGRITLLADERLRSENGWHGATIFATAPDGTEAAIECSFRPDLENEPTQCNAFILPNYECSVSHPFTDPGSGAVTMQTPFYLDVNGQASFFATEPVPDGCADITGATVTDAFFGQWDPTAGQGRSTTIADFPGQLITAWDNQP